MTRMKTATPFLLLGFSALSACSSVETGTLSPCHGQFQAEGQYFALREAADGTQIVVSTKNALRPGCGD